MFWTTRRRRNLSISQVVVIAVKTWVVKPSVYATNAASVTYILRSNHLVSQLYQSESFFGFMLLKQSNLKTNILIFFDIEELVERISDPGLDHWMVYLDVNPFYDYYSDNFGIYWRGVFCSLSINVVLILFMYLFFNIYFKPHSTSGVCRSSCLACSWIYIFCT